MSELVIRSATRSDFGDLCRVQKRAVNITLRELYPEEAIDKWLLHIDEAKFERVAASGEINLLAELAGKVVGFSSYKVSDSLIGMWYVDPSFHGQGIGSQLLRAAELALKNEGVKEANTEASQHAKPRFEKLGWRVVEKYDKPAYGTVMRVTKMKLEF